MQHSSKGQINAAYAILAVSVILLTGLILLSHEKNSPAPLQQQTGISQNNAPLPLAVLQKEKNVREPVAAGVFYPKDPKELDATVAGFFSNAHKLDLGGTVKAVIVPHAGYEYSGQVAAWSFAQLDKTYGKVFVLGPSHKFPLTGVSLLDATHFKTPLGEVPVSEDGKKLLGTGAVQNIPQAHAQEYSIENEVPFLQKQLGNFELVPLVVGETDTTKLKNAIIQNLDGNDLIVVSVDLSHYQTYDEDVKRDSESIRNIMSLDPNWVMSSDIDAPWAVATLVQIALQKGWVPVFITRANSGDADGTRDRVVGYAAIVFVDAKKIETANDLSDQEKTGLLKLARQAMTDYVTAGKKTEIDSFAVKPKFGKIQGCFVTLNEDNRLRGCIGHTIPQEELYKCIMDNSINAAVNDQRFKPVAKDELQKINIEISILGEPKKLDYSGPADLLNKLSPNIDGVIIQNGQKGATYLPQVWEQIPVKEDFMRNLCTKAELDAECWKWNNTEIFTYSAVVFRE